MTQMPNAPRLTEAERSILHEDATVDRCHDDYDSDEARELRARFDAHCRQQADR
ncbi:hypothetical protein [Streptomyces sp. NPDC018031]|uniref:hypothetical protein n=1 Tax=Streptomyces sp. NPDC018031 TaxID=3365033 RepID=UPI00378EFB5C